MVDVAEVYIWGHLIGAVQWIPEKSHAAFEFEKDFEKMNLHISPFHMPLGKERLFSFPELSKRVNYRQATFKGLPGLLADSLPDRYGNELINVWLARNGRPQDSMNPVEQLCFIGKRGMGALEFAPATPIAIDQAFDVEIQSLVAAAGRMLSQKESFQPNLKSDEAKAMADILRLGTSAGGARPKAIIAYNEQTGTVKSGQASAPEGYEHWLIKLDGVSDAQFGESQGYGRVEMAYHLMAKDCGIRMTSCRLFEENGRAHFMTKRFDRSGGQEKHHVQTLCAIRHWDYTNLLSYSYEQLFQTMRVLRLTYAEAEEMFRRMVFNVLATNCDDHTKNFSFIMKKDGSWELAPAYDICYSYDPMNNWVNQQTLSINGKRKNISKDDMLSVARANNIKKAEGIYDHIEETIGRWHNYADEVHIDAIKRAHIASNLRVSLKG